MKLKLGWLILSTSLLCGTSVIADTNKTNTHSQDGKTIAWIIVVDKNEIAAGKEALHKSKNPEVKKYARELVKDHTKNLSQTMTVSRNIHEKAVESDESNKLKEDGKKTMDKLKGLKDKEFDKEFIDSMVAGHMDAISTLDGQTGQVSNAKLATHVKATKEMIQHHLDEGKKVQQSLPQ